MVAQMKGDPEIRKARPEEAARLTALIRASKAHWGYSREQLASWAPALLVTSERIRQDPVYVAAVREKLAGFCALSGPPEEMHLSDLWIDPGWMGRGVGTLLLQHAVQAARRRGAHRLHVESDPNAEGFYLRRGAVRVGEKRSPDSGRRLPHLILDL